MKSKKITRLLLLLAVFVMLFSFDALAVGLNRANVTLYPGQKVTLKLSGGKSVRWTTSSKKIAAVKKKSTRTATVTAKKAGVVWVTGTYKRKPYTCRVQVVDPQITGDANVKVGINSIFTFTGPQSKKIKGKAVTWGKKGNTKKTLYWTISRKSVATLKPLSGGRVQVVPKKAGTATLRCRYAGKNYSLVLKVTDPAKDAEAARLAQQQAADAAVWSVRQTAINFAYSIANNDYYGYKLGWSNPRGYDCSRLVISSYLTAGIRFASNITSTRQINQFVNYGFQDVTGSVNLYTGAGLQPGDVLLKYVPKKMGHTELVSRIDENGVVYIVGARADLDGKDGDSSGAEISEMPYSGMNYDAMKWTNVFRYGTTSTAQPGAAQPTTPTPQPTEKPTTGAQYRVYVPASSEDEANTFASQIKSKTTYKTVLVQTITINGSKVWVAQIGTWVEGTAATKVSELKDYGFSKATLSKLS